VSFETQNLLSGEQVGLPTKAPKYENWEQMCTAEHSLMFSATGDQRFRERGNYITFGLRIVHQQ